MNNIKTRKKFSFIAFSIYLITISIVCALIFIYYFSKRLGDNLIRCAEDEVYHLASLVMNNSVKKYIEKMGDISIISLEKNNKNEIERIVYDTKILNQMKTNILDMIETDLDYMKDGKIEEIDINLNKISDEYYEKTNEGILFVVSMGSSLGNTFFSNLGPKIPLNLQIIGDATSDIKTNITPYGISSALVEISIEVEAVIVIEMPFMSRKIMVTNTIPLVMEIISGTIPNYYLNYGA